MKDNRPKNTPEHKKVNIKPGRTRLPNGNFDVPNTRDQRKHYNPTITTRPAPILPGDKNDDKK